MIDDPSIRMLAALSLSVAMGTWFRTRSRARLHQWEQNPEAARARAVRGAQVSSTGFAYVAVTIFCVGVVLLVEGVVALVHSVS